MLCPGEEPGKSILLPGDEPVPATGGPVPAPRPPGACSNSPVPTRLLQLGCEEPGSRPVPGPSQRRAPKAGAGPGMASRNKFRAKQTIILISHDMIIINRFRAKQTIILISHDIIILLIIIKSLAGPKQIQGQAGRGQLCGSSSPAPRVMKDTELEKL